MKNKLSIGIILVAAVLIALYAASRGRGQAEAAKATVAPIAVEVTPLVRARIAEIITAVGTIEAHKDVIVSSETSGRVTHVAVKVGDRVVAGSTLVQVDDELKAIAVEQARAQMMAAQTNYNKSEKDFHRAEKLAVTGDASDVELEGNRLAFHAGEAQLASATAGLKYAQRQYDDAKIKAPISGLVASKMVEVGEMVGPGKSVANIVDVSAIKVAFTVPEDQIARIHTGQEAILKIDSRPSNEFRGTVHSVGSKSETPAGHMYPVEVLVKNPPTDILKIGMFARIAVNASAADNALVVPKDALASDESHPTVYVVESGIARLRTITLGIRSADAFEVTGGLKEGDLVVTFGQKMLKDGSAVQYK